MKSSVLNLVLFKRTIARNIFIRKHRNLNLFEFSLLRLDTRHKNHSSIPFFSEHFPARTISTNFTPDLESIEKNIDYHCQICCCLKISSLAKIRTETNNQSINKNKKACYWTVFKKLNQTEKRNHSLETQLNRSHFR